MIPVEYYTISFYSLLCVFLFFMFAPLFKYYNLQRTIGFNLNFKVFIILLLPILFIGLRDAYGDRSYLGDTLSYTRMYQNLSMGNDLGFTKDPGFYFFMKFCTNWISVKWFYILCASLYVILPYLAFKKWFGNNALVALVMFVVSMSFWGYGVNGLRNGLATSFFIYALAGVGTNKIKLIFFMVLAYTFHQTLLLPILSYFFTLKFTKTKLLIKLWLVMVVISFFVGNYIEDFIGNIASLVDFGANRGQDMFADEYDGSKMNRGYRFDFILYSGLPILLGYVYVIKKGFNDLFYKRILHTYILTNIVWVFLIYAAYSNRIAYLSWFLMPVVMIYPLLINNLFRKQNQLIGYLVFGSLFFTLILLFL